MQLLPDVGIGIVGVEAAAFLSANDQEENVTKALTMGADDYLVKPFSSTELLARVASSLRKRRAAGALVPRQPFQLEGLVIDYTDRNVTISGRPVRLSSTEYKLLFELSINAGRVLTRDQILRASLGLGLATLARSRLLSLPGSANAASEYLQFHPPGH